ncbi:MAG: ATPase, partial [Pseudomonadota bacterium]
PLHLVEAPTEGTGKTLLAKVVSLVATGAVAQGTSLPRSEEEIRKKLTATLAGSPSVVLLDNVAHALDSESMAAVLTSEVWSDRLLGQTRMVHLPNRALWLATGNNPVLSRELARRAVRIRLDASLEQPWLRAGFRHPDLEAWAVTERPRLVAALITLVRGWIVDGRPEGEVALGSFEGWSRLVGGVLRSAGVAGFLADRHEQVAVSDPGEVEWGAFVALWAERLGERSVSGGELLDLAAAERFFDLDPQSASQSRERARFSRALAARRDRHYGPWRVEVRRDARRKQNSYGVVGAR